MNSRIQMPKSAKLNVALRERILKLGYADPAFARAIWYECSRDPIFFLNAFVWIPEVRPKGDWELGRKYGRSKELPFITRSYQDDMIEECLEAWGHRNIIIWKSREMGVTLAILALCVWDTIFHEGTKIGLTSDTEKKATDIDDDSSLMSMMKFMLDRLPCWIKGGREAIEHHSSRNAFLFPNESRVNGYAATGDFLRGGRKAVIVKDEFHFFPVGEDYQAMDTSADATYCRVFISTVNRDRGCSGAFYDICQKPGNALVITLDWWQDKDKAIGLYHSERIGMSERYELVIDDVTFWDKHKLPDGTYRHPKHPKQTYGFVLDGKKRSLYYDWRCELPGATPASVDSEIGRRFGASSSLLCDADTIDAAILRAKAPCKKADIYRDPDKNEWALDLNLNEGNIVFWCELTDGKPPPGDYAIGADISAGTKNSTSSYSCLQVFNRKTGENVAEWRSNRVTTVDYASLAVWLCRLFYNAYLVPEGNGIGNQFIDRLIDLRYTRVYRHKKKNVSYKESTDRMGYYHQDGGRMILESLQDGIKRGKAKVNSKLALTEMTKYMLKENGGVYHASSKTDEDVGGRGQAHGDSAIALACGWLGVTDIPIFEEQEKEKEVSPHSFLGRRMQYEKHQRTKGKLAYWNPSWR